MTETADRCIQPILDKGGIVKMWSERQGDGEIKNVASIDTFGLVEYRHKWMGDARDPDKPELSDHILCVIMGENEIFELAAPMAVTIIDDDVLCKKCLEWLHA